MIDSCRFAFRADMSKVKTVAVKTVLVLSNGFKGWYFGQLNLFSGTS